MTEVANCKPVAYVGRFRLHAQRHPANQGQVCRYVRRCVLVQLTEDTPSWVTSEETGQGEVVIIWWSEISNAGVNPKND